MAVTSYNYQPLLDDERQIRLLTLLPGSPDAQIHCQLEHFAFQESPRYRALSYVWGHDNASHSIVVNGNHLCVRNNLYRALQALRSVQPDVLWIDAICINQADVKEKSHQVSLMSEIYRRAEEVIIWLGIPVELGPLSRSSRHEKEGRDSRWLTSFLASPYWSRMWAVQELVLAPRKTLFCGTTTFTWEDFWEHSLPTTADAMHYSALHSSNFCNALQMRSIVDTQRTNIEILRKFPAASLSPQFQKWTLKQFWELLELCQKLDVTDPRDKIYGLMGLARAYGVALPSVDYGKSHSQVIADTKYVFRRSERSIPVHSPRDLYHTEEARAHIPELDPTNSGEADQDTNVSDVLCQQYSGVNMSDPITHEEFCQWYATLTVGNQQKALLDYITNRLVQLGNDQSRCKDDDRVHTHANADEDKGISCTLSSEGGSSTSTASEQACKSVDAASRSRTGARKRDRGADGEETDDNEDVQARKQPRAGESQGEGKQYACPFCQRNSHNPRLRRACRGPGFPSIPRVKEHLYRAHRVHTCPRCGDPCLTSKLLAAHLSCEPVCSLRLWRSNIDYDKGFDSEQEDEIRKVKGKDAWNRIYQVLFPNDPEDAYPPQYHCETQFMQFIDRFCTFYQQRARATVQQRLDRLSFRTSDNDVNGRDLRQQIMQLVSDVHVETIRAFRASSLQVSSTATGDSQHSDNPQAGSTLTDPNMVWLNYVTNLEHGDLTSSEPSSEFPTFAEEPDWGQLLADDGQIPTRPVDDAAADHAGSAEQASGLLDLGDWSLIHLE